jgi:uncharacterized membrane protein
LWAVGFDDPRGAAKVQAEINSLGWEKHELNLVDVAVAVRHRDGTLTLNGEPFPKSTKIHGGTIAHFLAYLSLGAPPLSGEAVGAMFARLGCTNTEVGISEDFVQDVEGLIKPETTVVFVLDHGGNMDVILPALRGLGGTVLKTNVDLERAKLIQSTLAASADTTQPK